MVRLGWRQYFAVESTTTLECTVYTTRVGRRTADLLFGERHGNNDEGIDKHLRQLSPKVMKSATKKMQIELLVIPNKIFVNFHMTL